MFLCKNDNKLLTRKKTETFTREMVGGFSVKRNLELHHQAYIAEITKSYMEWKVWSQASRNQYGFNGQPQSPTKHRPSVCTFIHPAIHPYRPVIHCVSVSLQFFLPLHQVQSV